MPPTTAAILSIGQELLLGQIADTNAMHIAARLLDSGWPVGEIRSVGDDEAGLTRAIHELTARHAALICSGGLGPTADDVTRQALAQAAGVDLREDAESLALLEARFRDMQRPMAPQNRVQALIPDGARALPNPVGTAAGIAIRIGTCQVFAVPGVPREMRHLLTEAILPALGRGPAGHVAVRELHLVDIGESNAGAALSDLMARGRMPDVGTRVQDGILTVRIVATAPEPDAAEAAADADAGEIRNRLGPCIFGEGESDLPRTVLDLLEKSGRSVATAESCTGGLVAKWLTDIPGSSAVFREGFVTYTNEAKTARLQVAPDLFRDHGAVSEPVARSLAEGARRVAGTDYGIGITGIAGPGGGTPEKPVGLVHIAVAGPERTDHCETHGVLDRDGNRRRAATVALSMLWRQLLAVVPAPAPHQKIPQP